jgi:hypothetical protein
MQNNADPRTWELSTWILAFAMSLGGGVIDVISKYQNKNYPCIKCIIISLLMRCMVASIIGLGTFMFFLSIGYSIGLSAALDGLAAHMGLALLSLLETKIKEKIDKL